MNNTTYDKVYVGTSPILLIDLLKNRKENEKIAIIEKNNDFGGAWQNGHIENLGIEVETACHLIEYYGNCYETLSNTSGEKFVRLDPQPVKILKDGRVINYSSRKSIIFDFIEISFKLLALTMIRLVNNFLSPINQIKKGQGINFDALKSNWKLMLSKKLIYIFKFDGIYGPQNGYEKFISKLKNKIKTQGVNIIHDSVEGFESVDNSRCLVNLKSKNDIYTRELIVSESFEYKEVNSDSDIIKDYWHILISLPKESLLAIQHYVHFPYNKDFHRITFVCPDGLSKNQQDEAFFLIQTRRNPASFENIKADFLRILIDCGTLKNEVEIKIHRIFSAKYFSGPCNKKNENLQKYENVRMVKSIGDLAKNICLNKMD